MELGQAAHLRARARQDREKAEEREPVLLDRRRDRGPRSRSDIHFREHAHQDVRGGQRPRRRPEVRRELRSDHRPGVDQRQNRGGKEHGAGARGREHTEDSERQHQAEREIPSVVQSRVPVRGVGRRESVESRPRADRARGLRRRSAGLHRAQRSVPELDTRRQDSTDQHVVVRAHQAGGQRVFGTTHFQHQLHVGDLRSYRSRHQRGGQGHWSRLQDRAQVFTGVRRIRRQLLPEGPAESGVHVRIFETPPGRLVLATGAGHERLSEIPVLPEDRPVDVQHGHRQEASHVWIRVQKGHQRHARVGRDTRRQDVARRGGQTQYLRPEGGARTNYKRTHASEYLW